jgi:hypothetical protein
MHWHGLLGEVKNKHPIKLECFSFHVSITVGSMYPEPEGGRMLRSIAKFLGAAFVGAGLIWSAGSAFAQAPQFDEDGTPKGTRPVKICGADPNDDVSAPDYTCVHPAPPPDFDPFLATPEELEKYGYPPKPTDPEALETCSEEVSAPVAPIPDGAVFTLVPHDSSLQLAPGQPPP